MKKKDEHTTVNLKGKQDASNGKLNQTIAEPKGDQAEKDNLTTAEVRHNRIPLSLVDIVLTSN